ncbi:MAG: dual specificity protein phosphatase family protein [Candidatus Hodarchaeota archaeon]
MQLESLNITSIQLITLKKQRKFTLTRLSYIAAISSFIIVSIGACQMQECSLKSGSPSGESQSKVSAKQAVERKWAERIELSGIPNLHKVSEDLYRGAQPSADGMRQLEKLGIKTVVNLRFILSDRNRIEGTGLDYEHINMTTWNPHTKDVVRFLQIVTDSDRTPVFVHCQHGIDRTGVLCAVYRIVVEGWNKDEAIEEMTKGSFAVRNIKKNLLDYIRKLNVEEIKCKADLSK